MGAERGDNQNQTNRQAVPSPSPLVVRNGKPIDESQFLSWKRQKNASKLARNAESARKREEEISAGTVAMNGRELFLYEPWVFDNSRY